MPATFNRVRDIWNTKRRVIRWTYYAETGRAAKFISSWPIIAFVWNSRKIMDNPSSNNECTACPGFWICKKRLYIDSARDGIYLTLSIDKVVSPNCNFIVPMPLISSAVLPSPNRSLPVAGVIN
jgi:hypothetical protein